MTDWVKPLQKHHGQHGGLIAVGLLVSSGLVVWVTSPRDDQPAVPHEPAPVTTTQRAVPMPMPAAMIASPPPPDVVQLPARVTATGFVSFDERRTTHLVVPVAGLLQKRRATWVGRRVRQGETLATIYSPEVYLGCVALLDQLKNFTSQEAVDRARYRLLRWGMPTATLAHIEQTMTPQLALPLVARLGGVVVQEQGAPRMMIDPSAGELFTITEPAYAWVFVDLMDADAARTKVGMPAKLRIEGITRPLSATVAYVYRRSEDGKRTVRFDIRSSSVKLHPGAAVIAELQLPANPGS